VKLAAGAVDRPLSALRPRFGEVWYEWRNSGRRRAAVRALTEVVQTFPPQPGLPPPARWSVQRVLPTETDVTVVVFGLPGAAPLAVGRITEPDAEDADLARNGAVLAELRADERLGNWRHLLPLPLGGGRARRRVYAVERAVPGRPATAALRRGSPGSAAVVDQGAAAISVLHRATATTRVVEDALFEWWVAAPLRLLEAVGPAADRRAPGPAVEVLAGRLRESLAGRPCGTGWTHGDYWSGNVLLDRRGQVAGIVDWGAARADGLPVVDLLHLLLTARARVEGASLGDVVLDALRHGLRSAGDRRVLARAEWSWPVGAPDDASLVLLTWLGHVAAVLTKRPAYRTDRRWLERNVGNVLRFL
jgi:Phosphotransferase enzyme family